MGKIPGIAHERADLKDVEKIATEVLKTETDDATPKARTPIAGYVYLMKSGRRYKTGHTNSPAR